jgi:hypothetical protein
MRLRNAPTGLMKEEGYGAGYRYAHDDEPEGMNDTYLPEEISDRVYYEPMESGDEAEIKEKLSRPGPQRVWYLRYAIKSGMRMERNHELTGIDPWFLDNLKEIVERA